MTQAARYERTETQRARLQVDYRSILLRLLPDRVVQLPPGGGVISPRARRDDLPHPEVIEDVIAIGNVIAIGVARHEKVGDCTTRFLRLQMSRPPVTADVVPVPWASLLTTPRLGGRPVGGLTVTWS
jgi:hypothetical protein